MAEEKRSGPLYKIVLAGDVGVGKTSIFQRYDKDKFYDHKNPTFGMDSLTRDVMIDGKRICQVRSRVAHHIILFRLYVST